jgi:hypothetical protein
LAILCLREGYLGHGERQYAYDRVTDAQPLCQDSCRPDRTENQGGENMRDRSGPIRTRIKEQGRKTLASASAPRWPIPQSLAPEFDTKMPILRFW